MKSRIISLLTVLIFSEIISDFQVAAEDIHIIAESGQNITISCDVGTGATVLWRINESSSVHTLNDLFNGAVAGHSVRGSDMVIQDIIINDVRNGSLYQCEIPQLPPDPNIEGNVTMLCVAGVPAVVPNVTVDNSSINDNGGNVTISLRWGEPFNNFDPIIYYTVLYSSNDTCPQRFNTTDNTTRSYTITNLTPLTNYTFSVAATNSIGSGEAGTLNHTFEGEVKDYVAELELTCKPMDMVHECTVTWNDVSQGDTTKYQVCYSDSMKNVCNPAVNFFTFTLEPLLDDERIGSVSCNVTAINKCSNVTLDSANITETYDAPSVDYAVIFVAINLASSPKILNDTHYMVNISINATDIPLAISALNQEDPKVMAPNDIISMTQSPSDSSDATFVMQNSNEAIDRYNIIIIIDLHDNSGADKVNVTVMSEEGMIMTASGSVMPNSSIAVVNITELKCGIYFTIIAGGVMSDGTLAGPKLMLGKPPKISCVSIQSNGNPNLNLTSTLMPITTSSSSPVVYIVSGVVGGIVVVIGIIFIFMIFYIVKRRSKDPEIRARVKPVEGKTNEEIDNALPEQQGDVQEGKSKDDQKGGKHRNNTQEELPEKQGDVPEYKSSRDCIRGNVPKDKSNNDQKGGKQQNDTQEEPPKKQVDVQEDKSQKGSNQQTDAQKVFLQKQSVAQEKESKDDQKEVKQENDTQKELPQTKQGDMQEDKSKDDQKGGKELNEGGVKYVDINVSQGPKIRGGDDEHDVAYGQVVEKKEKPLHYADISAHRGPRKRGGDEHVVTYGQVAGAKPLISSYGTTTIL